MNLHDMHETVVAALTIAGLTTGCCKGNASQPDPVRWACSADTDCMNSCALGAVNASWYRAHAGSIEECEDGCANQVAAPPRCIDGSCVAFQRDPSDPRVVKKHPYCTRKQR